MEHDSTQTATLTSFVDNAEGYRVPLSTQSGGQHWSEKQNEDNADQCCMSKSHGKNVSSQYNLYKVTS